MPGIIIPISDMMSVKYITESVVEVNLPRNKTK